ncbi:helicase-associated domain-containing protein [Paenibacillus thermotolerans]|uniref:helicase-associated domain-containing protein n=1 Tax=Paenibacillus thermotolerans TaxID=3027807 RepID=UPI002368644C|nr:MULTISPECIES: helicase-associated domain-containing protein [unclassified Paenibacillus]
MIGQKPQLSGTEEKTLRAIVIHFAEEPFTCEALEAAAPWELTGWEAEAGVAGLRRRGIVTTRKKAWGERIHTLADGVFVYWQQLFVGGGESLAIPAGRIVPSYEPRRGIASLLFGLLSAARYTLLPLTQKGTLHKRDLQRLSERLDVSDEELAGLQNSYLHQDKYGIAFAVVYDMALRLGLLTGGVDRIAANPKRLEEWLGRSRREMNERLLAIWREVYMPSDVWLQHAAALLQSLPAGQWTSVSRMTELLLSAGVPQGGRTQAELEDAIRACWLRPMRAFGWLELGNLHGEEDAVRWKQDPDGAEEAGTWYVQPDFEVLVPPGVPFSLRWGLEACCQYAGGEELEKYRLTKESLTRALDLGMSAEDVTELLRRGSKHGVPSNVEETVRGWGSRYGTVTMENVTLLRCRDSKDAEDIRSHPMTAPYVITLVGDRDLIVRSGMADELFDVLKRQGYDPRKEEGEVPPPSAEEGKSPESPGGLVYSRRTAALFPVDPAPPAPESVRLAEQVPQAWIKQLRRYHLSTMRDLVETAVRLRTNVKLGRDGELKTFYPRRMERMNDRWFAVGYMDGAEARIAIEEWAEAQLLLPE